MNPNSRLSMPRLSLRKFSQATVLSTAASLILATATFSPAQADEAHKPGIIEVQATGKSSVVPDMAIISLGVTSAAKTAREALNENTASMKNVLEGLKAEGIEGRDLQTSNFNIRPRYNNRKAMGSAGKNKSPELIGYNVNNSLTIRIRDISKVGLVLDKVVSLGVNSNGNIRFTNENPEHAIEDARKDAVANAYKKAAILAEAAGVSLGKVLTIRENGSNHSPRALGRSAQFDGAQNSPVPVAAGENTYNINVSMSWEIGQ